MSNLITATAEREVNLKQAGWRVHIQRTGSATKGIAGGQKKRNRRVDTGANGRQPLRCIGSVRLTFALYLKVASYNLKWLVFLNEGGPAPFQSTNDRVRQQQNAACSPRHGFPLCEV